MDVDVKPLFAVFVPASDTEGAIGRVFDTVVEATAFAKDHKARGARFKQFFDAASAESFTQGQVPETPRRPTSNVDAAPNSGDGAPASPSSLSEGPPSPFAALSRIEMSAFKRAIEQLDDAKFEELIQDNPRYIVNYNGDTPTIVFEGSRYNALHIAARSKNVHVTKRVLELVSDVCHRLLQRLYPDDPVRINERRRLHLLDCYLNTPDKSVNETPLHFASKSGCVPIVELLVGFKACQKDIKNKYDQTPGDMACEKMSDASPEARESAKKRILSLLSKVYVPLYRPIDFSGSALLLPPVKEYPSEVLSSPPPTTKLPFGNEVVPSSPALRSEMRLAAVAGPCSAEKAAAFYQSWSSAKRDVRRADLHKGYEQAGRALAIEQDVEWTEWWPFLGAYANLGTVAGLTRLESHLMNAVLVNNDGLYSDRKNKLSQPLSLKNPLDARLQSSPWFGGGVQSLYSTARPQFDGASIRKKLRFADPDEDSEGPASQSVANGQVTAAGVTVTVDNDENDDSMDFQDSLAEPSDIVMADLCSRLERNGSLSDSEDDDDGSFVTPPSTPPPVFMAGVTPTKVDCDVFMALLLAVQRDEAILKDFPRTLRWFNAMQGYSPKQRNAWPSLDSPRAQRINSADGAVTQKRS